MRFLFWFLIILLIFIRRISSHSQYQNGQKIRITSVVYQQPIQYSYYQQISLVWFKIYLPKYPEIFYGDKVVVEGTVENGRLQDAVLVGKKESRNLLYNVRVKIVDFYKKSLPEPHASLIAGITLGAKGSLPADFWEGLKTTGTAHVVVASGMNVTMVASSLIGILATIMKRRKALIFALLGVWAYVGLSGFEAPIVRAAVMGSIAFAAQGAGRVYSAWRALVLSGAGMLIIFPDWLYDLGFVLSFVATASLIVFQSRVDRLVSFIPKLLREGLSTSLAAQIGVSPILFVTFGQFNILSPIVNGLILWTVPYIMVLGAIGGTVGLLFPLPGRAILFLGYPLTAWFTKIVEIFAF